ncbi:DUF924 family protein [Pseudoxanthomonas dokdonensis]|uniref:SpoVR like family protein n=1 Tax=Pseudoxanthomonas dokdonensis TaxID=344882 RepID=A0A0R0CS19_9GAMM|nr:DUF924 family protein [Pseudoxanthomonas dokdonensis]KRG67560.1 hypothetical protein ABB29_15475 [Pseudoxanthomonas dokdonensis]
MSDPGEVVRFWQQAGAEKWFSRDDAFDNRFRQRFSDDHHAAARGEYESWLQSAEGALALLLLLDQFPRNCFRGSAHSYATDGLARHYAERALEAGHDQAFEPALRAFFYLPFEHSESMQDQQRSLALFTALNEGTYQRYAQLHLDIIERFGRFPHRNPALGRVSTQQELDYLAEGGFKG